MVVFPTVYVDGDPDNIKSPILTYPPLPFNFVVISRKYV